MFRNACCLLLVAVATEIRADDWPQFRGQRRDGVSLETNLRREWTKEGPPHLWTFSNAGIGYSGPSIVGDRLFTCGGRGDAEYVFALDLKKQANGGVQELWATKIGPLFNWKGNSWNAGPSSTPTVDGELIYAMGGFGDLVCVEAATGKVRWRKNLPRELAGEVNPIGGGLETPTPLGWGYAWSPLVNGQHLIITPGGTKGLLAALDKSTGKVLWQSQEIMDQAPYSSPMAAEIEGTSQYVQVTNSGIVGVSAKDGRKLWAYQREPAYDDVVIATPVIHDNHVFATVGFQQGCDLVHVSASNAIFTVAKVYSNKAVENRDGGVVLVNGHLYGHSENKGWFCMDFKTGTIAWSEKGKLGRGSIAGANGLLVCCAEQGGIVALLEATSKGYTERGRFTLSQESKLRKPSGGLWTHPVIANGRLYLRDQELLFCFDLKP